MTVQFSSYSGGGHGGSPVVLPGIRQSPLGDIGSFMNQIGQIPGEMQQAQLKTALNSLLMKALTTPQTVDKTIPGGSMMNPDVSFDEMQPDQSMLTMPNGAASMGDFLTQAPDKTIQAANPDYTKTVDRLTTVGPAFGMKFPTPIEHIYAAALAKSLGAGELEKEKQTGRMELQGVKGEQKQADIKTTYESKGSLESDRQANRIELLKNRTDSSEKIAKEHNDTLVSIAQDKNINDQQKTDKIIKERDKYHSGQLEARQDYNNILRKTANSADDLRQATEADKLNDNLTAARTQINKLQQQDQTDPSVQTQLQGALEQYNALVDKANADPNAPKIDKWQLNEKPGIINWLRQFNPLGGSPKQEIRPVPQSKTTAPKATTTPQVKPASPAQISEDELTRRRNAIFDRLKQGR